MLKGIETGRDKRLLLRPGMARLKGLETLRVVRESWLELNDVMTLRRGFLGEDIEVAKLRGLRSCSGLFNDKHVRCIPRFQGNSNP